MTHPTNHSEKIFNNLDIEMGKVYFLIDTRQLLKLDPRNRMALSQELVDIH